jgi:hypothetical protein
MNLFPKLPFAERRLAVERDAKMIVVIRRRSVPFGSAWLSAM